MKCALIYKCLLCGKAVQYGKAQQISLEPLEQSLEASKREAIRQILIKNQNLWDIPALIPCECPDGNVGLALFAGFKRVE